MAKEKTSYRDVAIYAAIAIVVVVAVWAYTSAYLNPTYYVSVKLQPVGASAQPYPYQVQRLRIIVNNTGKTAVSGATLVLYMDNQVLHNYQISLPPGAGATINATYTYPVNGTYVFQAVVDPAHVLQIGNRTAAQGSLTVNVLPPAQPNIYTTVPDSNITSTESFSAQQLGLASLLFLAANYNISAFSNMLGDGNRVVTAVFQDIYQQVSTVNGAYLSYSNSAHAYVAWMSGQVTPRSIALVVGSFGTQQRNATVNGANVTYARLDNRTSLCTLSGGGWTKMVEYYNASSAQTCLAVLQRNYSGNESRLFVGILKANPDISRYQKRLEYANTTPIGAALLYSNGTLSTLNIFVYQNGGFFTGEVTHARAPANVSSANITCRGINYAYNGFGACSAYIVPKGGSFGVFYALINTTQVTSNYTLSLFSLVNYTQIENAHNNALVLLRYVNASGPSEMWSPVFRNGCAFLNSSIGCAISGFNRTTRTAYLNITNRFQSPIRANRIACYLAGTEMNKTINASIPAGGRLLVNTTCNGLTIPGGFTLGTSYALLFNFTLSGTLRGVFGNANVTNYN